MQRVITCFRFIAYPLIISLAILNVPFPALAQEDITITTYYPSPSGSFNELTISSFLNFENGAFIRVRQPGVGFVNVAQLFWDHINFLVPINPPGGGANPIGIWANNLTVNGTLIVGGIDVGGALGRRWLWDLAIFANQQVQSSIIVLLCTAIVLPDAAEVIAMIGVAALLVNMALLPPPFLN